MKRCDACKHWEETDFDDGKCSKIREKVEINLVTGSEGGYVDYIETPSDFCCSLFESVDGLS